MKKSQINIAFISFLTAVLSLSTKPSMHTVLVNLKYGEKAFVLNDSSNVLDGKALVFTRLRFYLSQFELFYNDSLVWQQNESYHLVDAENLESQRIGLNFPESLEFNKLQFSLGIDSATSTAGAMGGDLDPTKGMFWTWNSGYINFKLEGQYAKCPTRKNEFQYHIGGYKKPFETLQTFTVLSSKNETRIDMDLQQLLSSLNLEKDYRVMSPGEKAQGMSMKSRKMFVNALAK